MYSIPHYIHYLFLETLFTLNFSSQEEARNFQAVKKNEITLAKARRRKELEALKYFTWITKRQKDLRNGLGKYFDYHLSFTRQAPNPSPERRGGIRVHPKAHS